MNLGELIDALKKADPDLIVADGFCAPHSYRGYYDHVAFEPRRDVSVRHMLAAAESAVGATYEGWKGGTYTMDRDSVVHIAKEGHTDEAYEGLDPRHLDLILQVSKLLHVETTEPKADTPKVAVGPWPKLDRGVELNVDGHGKIVIDGYSVPILTAIPWTNGMVSFLVDGRMSFDIPAEIAPMAARLAVTCMALGLGLPCFPYGDAIPAPGDPETDHSRRWMMELLKLHPTLRPHRCFGIGSVETAEPRIHGVEKEKP